MNWFRKMMIGRYGTDKLGVTLLVLSIVLSTLGSIVKSEMWIFISYVPLGWCLFRMFSKNIYARANENSKFIVHYTPVEHAIKEKCKLIFGTKTHKYYRCTMCKQLIRVPKVGKKIEITCPKCKNQFVRKP